MRSACCLAITSAAAMHRTPPHAAAHLAYALHNQADAVLQGGTFDVQQALGTIDAVDRMLGTRFQERLFQVTALTPPTPEPRG